MFERLHGPILLHERLDYGFALVSAVLASIFDKRRHSPSEFVPKWYAPPKPVDDLFAFMNSFMREESSPARSPSS